MRESRRLESRRKSKRELEREPEIREKEEE